MVDMVEDIKLPGCSGSWGVNRGVAHKVRGSTHAARSTFIVVIYRFYICIPLLVYTDLTLTSIVQEYFPTTPALVMTVREKERIDRIEIRIGLTPVAPGRFSRFPTISTSCA